MLESSYTVDRKFLVPSFIRCDFTQSELAGLSGIVWSIDAPSPALQWGTSLFFLIQLRTPGSENFYCNFSAKYSNQDFSFWSSHVSVWLILLAIDMTWGECVPRKREEITPHWIPNIGEAYIVRRSLSAPSYIAPFQNLIFHFRCHTNPRVESYLRSLLAFAAGRNDDVILASCCVGSILVRSMQNVLPKKESRERISALSCTSEVYFRSKHRKFVFPVKLDARHIPKKKPRQNSHCTFYS